MSPKVLKWVQGRDFSISSGPYERPRRFGTVFLCNVCSSWYPVSVCLESYKGSHMLSKVSSDALSKDLAPSTADIVAVSSNRFRLKM